MNFRTSIFMFLFFSVIAAGMIWHVKTLQTNVVEKSSLNYAKLYSDALIAFRSLYSSEVVEKAEAFGMEVTHDYHEKASAIPLPATLSMLLGQKIGDIGTGVTARLYSPYPFPWRKETGGLRDDFAIKAWHELNKNPDKPHFIFDQINGKKVLRYAVADKMRSSCIDCHNHHPDSVRRDWKINEVIGVLDITVPLDYVISSTKKDLQLTVSLYSLLAFLGVLGLVTMVSRHRKESAILEDAVKMRTLELEREKVKAETASRAKTKFLSRMSHEVRTPLNAIMGFGQLLEVNLEKETEKDYCREIIGAGSHLLDLINEVLDLSKIEAGRLNLEMEPLPVNSIISSACRMIKPLAQIKNIEIYFNRGTCEEDVLADKKCLKQALINLLSNAVKYNRQNGKVEIRVLPEKDDKVRITVTDTGYGLNEEQIKNLFQPFERVGAEKSGIDGLGIGLAICKKLLKAMNGSIGVRSEAGKGTTFWIELPRFTNPPSKNC